MKRRLLHNISWLFVDKVIRIFGGLAVGVWVARYLGPHDLGMLRYALAYTGLFVTLVDLGLSQIVVRELVKTASREHHILGTAFVMKLAGALLAICGVCASLRIIDLDDVTKAAVLIVSIGFVFQSLDVIDSYYQSRVLSKYVAIARTGAFILISLTKAYLITHEYTVLHFAVAGTMEVVLAGLLLIFGYQKNGGRLLRWQYSAATAKTLLKYSWPLALSGILVSIHMRIDQVMIGNMLGKEDVGIYSIAVGLAEAWICFPIIVVSTCMPYFVKLRDVDNALYHHRLLQLYSVMFWMGMAVGIVTTLVGKAVIHAVFGEAYVGAYSALVINVWSGVFTCQAIARSIYMISENLQKYRLYNNVMAVSANVILNILLIPKLNIAGAAIATLATQALGTWVFSLFWKPLRASTWGMIKAINPMYMVQVRVNQ